MRRMKRITRRVGRYEVCICMWSQERLRRECVCFNQAIWPLWASMLKYAWGLSTSKYLIVRSDERNVVHLYLWHFQNGIVNSSKQDSQKTERKTDEIFRNGLSCKARGLRMMMSEKSGWNDSYIESTDLDWWITSHVPFPPSSLIFTPSGMGVVDEDSPRLLQQHPRSCFNSLIAIQDAHISPTTRNGV